MKGILTLTIIYFFCLIHYNPDYNRPIDIAGMSNTYFMVLMKLVWIFHRRSAVCVILRQPLQELMESSLKIERLELTLWTNRADTPSINKIMIQRCGPRLSLLFSVSDRINLPLKRFAFMWHPGVHVQFTAAAIRRRKNQPLNVFSSCDSSPAIPNIERYKSRLSGVT